MSNSSQLSTDTTKATKPPKPEIMIAVPIQKRSAGMDTFASETRGSVVPSTMAEAFVDKQTLRDPAATTTTNTITITIANTHPSDDSSNCTPTAPFAEESLQTPLSKIDCGTTLPSSSVTTPARVSSPSSSSSSSIMSQRDRFDRHVFTPMTPLTPPTPATTASLMSTAATTPTPTAHSSSFACYFPATPASAATSYTVQSCASSSASHEPSLGPAAAAASNATPRAQEKGRRRPSEYGSEDLVPHQDQEYYLPAQGKDNEETSRPPHSQRHVPLPVVPPLIIPVASSPRQPPRRRPPYSRAPSSSSLSTPSSASRGPPTAETLQSMSEWRRIQYEAAATQPPPEHDDLLPCTTNLFTHATSSSPVTAVSLSLPLPLSSTTATTTTTTNGGGSSGGACTPLSSLKMQPHRPAALLAPISTNFHHGSTVLSSTSSSAVSPPVSAFPRSDTATSFGSGCTGGRGREGNNNGQGSSHSKAGDVCDCCGCSSDDRAGAQPASEAAAAAAGVTCRCAAAQTPSSAMTFGPDLYSLIGCGSEATTATNTTASFKYLQPQGTRSYPHHLQTAQQQHPLTVFTSGLNLSTPTLGGHSHSHGQGGGPASAGAAATSKFFLLHGGATAAGSTATLGSDYFGSTASTAPSEYEANAAPEPSGTPEPAPAMTTNKHPHPYYAHHAHHLLQRQHPLASVSNLALSSTSSSSMATSSHSSLHHSNSAPNLRSSNPPNAQSVQQGSSGHGSAPTAFASSASEESTSGSAPSREITSSMVSLSALIGGRSSGGKGAGTGANCCHHGHGCHRTDSSRSSGTTPLIRTISKFSRSGSTRRRGRRRVVMSFVAQRATEDEDDEDGEGTTNRDSVHHHNCCCHHHHHNQDGECGCMSIDEGEGGHPSFHMVCQPLSMIKDGDSSSGRVKPDPREREGTITRGSSNSSSASVSMRGSGTGADTPPVSSSPSSACGCCCHGSPTQGKGTPRSYGTGRRSMRSGDGTSEYMTATASTATASQGRPSKERKPSLRLHLSGLRRKHKQNKLLQKAGKLGSSGSGSVDASGGDDSSQSEAKSLKKKGKGTAAGQKDWSYNLNSSFVRQEFTQYNYERQIQDFQRAARIFKEQKALTTAAAAAAIAAETRAAVAEAQAASAKAAAKKKKKAPAAVGSAAGSGSSLKPVTSMTDLEERGLPSPIQEEAKCESEGSSLASRVSTPDETLDHAEQGGKSALKDTPELTPAQPPKPANVESVTQSKRREPPRLRLGTAGSTRASVRANSNLANDISFLELGQVGMDMQSDLRLPRLRVGSGLGLGSMEMDRFLQESSKDTSPQAASAGMTDRDDNTPAAPFENVSLGEPSPSFSMSSMAGGSADEGTGGSGGLGIRALGMANSSPRPPLRRVDDAVMRRSSNISRNDGITRFSPMIGSGAAKSGGGSSSSIGGNGTIGSSFMMARSTQSIYSIHSVSQQIAARHQQHSLRLQQRQSTAGSFHSQAASPLGFVNSGYMGGSDLPPPSPAFMASNGSSTASHSPVTATAPSTCLSTSELLENSPVQVVRATVGTVDDPSLPCFTFRMWVLSTLFVALGAVSSEYNFFRANSAYFSIYFVQLASYFCGKAMARWLPKRQWTIRLDFRPLVRCWKFLFAKDKSDHHDDHDHEDDIEGLETTVSNMTLTNATIASRHRTSTRGSVAITINGTENGSIAEPAGSLGSGRSILGGRSGKHASVGSPLAPHLDSTVPSGTGTLQEPSSSSQLQVPTVAPFAFPRFSFQEDYVLDQQQQQQKQQQPFSHVPLEANRSTPGRAVRPKTTRGLFKWTFTLNNGKFNMKEHMLIGVAAAAGSVPAYATNVLAIQALVFNEPLGKLTGIGLVISSQCIGYSLAWCFFDFVIKPSVMVWPAALVNVSLYNTLHEHKVLTRWFTRMQLFWYAFFAVFVYQWLPRFFAPVLTSMALLCWINPSSNVLRKLGSGYTGLGIGCISLDWSIISGVGPLYTPWWAQANFFIGLIVMLWIVTPIVYFTNYWSAQSYPIVSSNLYDQNAALYDISKIVNADLSFNETMYNNYSPVMMTPYFAITYGTSFMAVMATFTHVALFYGSDIWRITVIRSSQWKERMHRRWNALFGDKSSSQEQQNGFNGHFATATPTGHQQYYCSTDPVIPCSPSCQHSTSNDHRAQVPTAMFGSEDIHTRLMRAYKDIPGFWFAILFAISFAMAVFVCNDPSIQLPFYALLLGFLLAAMFALPMAIIQALSSSQVGLNVLSEVVCGWLLPGNQLGNSVFKCYSYMALFQCLNLAQSLKLGHYMKVGPRKIFIMVLYGTLLGAFLNVQVLEWILTYNRQDLFTGDPHSGWSLRNLDLFFSASLLWGAISPKRLFAADSLYHFLPYCFLIGLVLPVPFYIMFRMFPPSTAPALSSAFGRSRLARRRRRALARAWSWPWSWTFSKNKASSGHDNQQKTTKTKKRPTKMVTTTCEGPLSACLVKADHHPSGPERTADEFCQDPTCTEKVPAVPTAAGKTPSSPLSRASTGGGGDDRSSAASSCHGGKWWHWWRTPQWFNKLSPSGRRRSGADAQSVEMDEAVGAAGKEQSSVQYQHHHHHHHYRQPCGMSTMERIDDLSDDEDLEAGYDMDEADKGGEREEDDDQDEQEQDDDMSMGHRNMPDSRRSSLASRFRQRRPTFSYRVSRLVPWHLINTPLICVGASFVPQAPASFVMSAGIVAFVFAFLVLRHRHEWWRRYTFVLAAALDAGTQICNMAIFVVFSLALADRVEFLQWAGNEKSNPERCGVGDGYN